MAWGGGMWKGGGMRRGSKQREKILKTYLYNLYRNIDFLFLLSLLQAVSPLKDPGPSPVSCVTIFHGCFFVAVNKAQKKFPSNSLQIRRIEVSSCFIHFLKLISF